MENLGIELSINNKQICRAGFQESEYVLASVLTSVVTNHNGENRSVDIRLGGLAKRKHVEWKAQQLKKGDKISMKIIRAPFDSPNKTTFTPEEIQLLHKKKMYMHLKKELEEARKLK